MKSGIYCIENLVNGKKYIGRGSNVIKRMKAHHRENPILSKAFIKYGIENFRRYILIFCEKWELDRLEIEYIRLFNSHYSMNGYNISFGGDKSREGLLVTFETRRKISNSLKGNIPWNKGKTEIYTDETKNKISNSLKGNIPWNKGKTGIYNEETKIKMGKSNIGKKPTEESKKKKSESLKKAWEKRKQLQLKEAIE
jgi:group I intron endonuclease